MSPDRGEPRQPPWPVIMASLASLTSLLAIAWPLHAEPACPDGPCRRERLPHGTMTVGGLAGLTGPLAWGAVAEAEFFPGGWFGRYGAHLSLHSDFAGERGLFTAGLAFEAGATRPMFVLSLHADAGAGFGPARFAAGGGLRAQLGLWGPLVVATSSTAHLLVAGSAGEDSRLALAVTFTAGFSR